MSTTPAVRPSGGNDLGHKQREALGRVAPQTKDVRRFDKTEICNVARAVPEQAAQLVPPWLPEGSHEGHEWVGFGMKPKQPWVGGGKERRYLLEELKAAWSRYASITRGRPGRTQSEREFPPRPQVVAARHPTTCENTRKPSSGAPPTASTTSDRCSSCGRPIIGTAVHASGGGRCVGMSIRVLPDAR